MELPTPAATQVSATHQPLEQFLLLAKSTKGAAVVGLIKQVIEAPGVYVFGELLEMPNVQEVSCLCSRRFCSPGDSVPRFCTNFF